MRDMYGDLFTSHCAAIGHGVNTKGLMGAGIAKAFKEKYEDNYLVYGMMCQVNGLNPGETLVVPAYEKDFLNAPVAEQRFIANMASQDWPGADASYQWLHDSALAAARQLKSVGINELAIPEIGCGIGGLEWDCAELVLKAVECIVGDFEFEVWHFAPQIDVDKSAGM